jgi:hypothetical protein
MVFQIHQNALNMVDREGTPNALPDLPRSHHEMFHEELASTVEQLRKSHLALRRIKYVSRTRKPHTSLWSESCAKLY